MNVPETTMNNQSSGKDKFYAFLFVVFMYFVAPLVVTIYANSPITNVTFFNCFVNDDKFGKSLLLGALLSFVAFILRFKIIDRNVVSSMTFKAIPFMTLLPFVVFFGVHTVIHRELSVLALIIAYVLLLVAMTIYVAFVYTIIESLIDSFNDGSFIYKIPIGMFLLGFFLVVWSAFVCGVNGAINA